MNLRYLKRKWAMVAATALVTGGLLTGVAMAGDPAALVTSAVTEGSSIETATERTPAESEVHQQLKELKRATMVRFKSERKQLLDQAVKEGKLTKEQAEKMMEHRGHHHRGLKGEQHKR